MIASPSGNVPSIAMLGQMPGIMSLAQNAVNAYEVYDLTTDSYSLAKNVLSGNIFASFLRSGKMAWEHSGLGDETLSKAVDMISSRITGLFPESELALLSDAASISKEKMIEVGDSLIAKIPGAQSLLISFAEGQDFEALNSEMDNLFAEAEHEMRVKQDLASEDMSHSSMNRY